jgi:Cu(I)/Ag(I) efflux system membrane fusion protein
MRRGAVLAWIAGLVVIGLAGGLWLARETPPDRETAMTHGLKHLEPGYFCPMHPQVTSDKPGRCPICGMDLVQSATAGQKGKREILYYRNPMDPAITSPVPNKDSMGMDYIPVYAGEGESGDFITVAPEVIGNLGVRTAKVERGTLPRRIDTVGYVGYDESLIGHVHLRTEGWIERLTVTTVGDRVEAGQLLFTLYSPTLVNAQEEYVQALGRGNERLIEASRQKLRALGVAPAQIEALQKTRKVERSISVFAHHHGVVSALDVREGMFVEPATETMTIVDLRSVWLLAEVFEQQSAWVQIGQQAEARIPSMPGRTWTGAVEYVYPSLDAQTRTLKVRLRFENPGEILKPNMFAHVGILASPRENVLTVPADAVIRDGAGERVVLALGGGRFAPRAIRSGIENAGRVEVLDGVSEGEDVVVSAQFLLDSEAGLSASFRRMESPPPPRPSPYEGEGDQVRRSALQGEGTADQRPSPWQGKSDPVPSPWKGEGQGEDEGHAGHTERPR